MKTIKLIFIITVISLFLVSSLSTVQSQSSRMKDRFYLGPFNFYSLNELRTDSHKLWYQQLSYNMMQNYCGHFDSFPSEWYSTKRRDGGFFEDLDNYKDYISGVIKDWDDIENITGGENSLLLEREKILRPGYGQSSIYEAEEIGTWHSKSPGYGYIKSETGRDTLDFWQGESVMSRCCLVSRGDMAGFIVDSLYENCEQVNNTKIVPDNENSNSDRLHSDIKQPRYKNRWYIKPRMRIDSNYAKANPDSTVVIIYIKAFDGHQIDSFTITCDNFLIRENGNKYYNGRYLERFLNTADSNTFLSVRADSLAVGKDSNSNIYDSKVDFSVKWLGKVDVWLDYVKVEDSWAHFLFTDTWENEGNPNNPNPWKFHRKIKEEVLAFMGEPGFGYFWFDEAGYNCIPCIGEVNRLVKEYSDNQTSLVISSQPDCFRYGGGLRNIPERHKVYKQLFKYGAVSNIFTISNYPFLYYKYYPSNLHRPDSVFFPGTKYFQPSPSRNAYTSDIQSELNNSIILLRQSDSIAKSNDLIFSFIMQCMSDEKGIRAENGGDWGLREPTNEEIGLQTYLGLAHGAKHIFEYSYSSDKQSRVNPSGFHYFEWGLVDTTPFLNKRYINYYRQPKWQYVSELNIKLRSIGDYLYPPGQINEHKKLDNVITVNPFQGYTGYQLPYSCITDIRSLAPLINGINPCMEIEGLNEFYDCPDERYWDIGFFENNSLSSNQYDRSYYFLAVNKRTYPNVSGDGDMRILKIKFNPSYLINFNNWVLKDAVTDSVYLVFQKSNTDYLTTAAFLPGEGKLFKLAPVMQEGGTFVCDEEVINQKFVCKGLVNTGGYDLTIKSENTGQTIISFKQNCGIYAENSDFIYIEGASVNNKIIFQGYGSEKWNGINANNCGHLQISLSEFKNLNGNWSVSAYNCPEVYVSSCRFGLGENNSKAINVNNAFGDSVFTFASICNNSIDVKSPTAAICLIATGGCEIDSRIEDNVITSTEGSSYGLFLSNNFSPVVSDNFISGFDAGLRILGTDINLCDNTITSSINNSYGIFASVSSKLKMGYEGGIFGRNKIENFGAGCNNIKLDNSVFYMDLGQNALKVNSESSSYNMFGTGEFETSGDGPEKYIEAKQNCFNGPGNNAVYSIQLHEYPYTNYLLRELPHYCTFEQDMIADYIFPTYTNLTDTVFKLVNTPELTSNSRILNKNLMKTFLQRNYDSARYISTVLLNTYSDSIFTPPVIKILYLSSSKLDTAGELVTASKTFLEQLILNQSQNVPLVKSAYYYIQKCKVQLHQYTSALTGFQDIIVQNPYSYEGLMASWDYAATQLIANSGGAYVDNDELSSQWLNIFLSENQLLNDTLRINKILKTDIYDKNVFSKEERKIYIKSVGNVLRDEREKQIEKVKNLEEKFNQTNENQKERNLIKNELDEAKVLNSVIKTKTPKDDKQYIMIINNDIEKIGRKSSYIENGNNNSIPGSYELKQNYPNPFNPVTKISFALPKESKVKLIIYDMLGREVARLINNENLSAGTYIREFNGSNLASGIYFLRILVNDGIDFTDVKKIVLLK